MKIKLWVIMQKKWGNRIKLWLRIRSKVMVKEIFLKRTMRKLKKQLKMGRRTGKKMIKLQRTIWKLCWVKLKKAIKPPKNLLEEKDGLNTNGIRCIIHGHWEKFWKRRKLLRKEPNISTFKLLELWLSLNWKKKLKRLRRNRRKQEPPFLLQEAWW